jgi:hypothetical protein
MEKTLEPKKLGDIVKETFRVYGRNIWRFAAIIAIVAIPLSIFVLLVIAAIVFINPPAPGDGFEGFILNHLPTLTPLFVIIMFISIAVETLAQGAMVYCTGQQYFRHPIENGYAYRFSWKRLANMFGAVLLITLTTLAIFSIPVGLFYYAIFNSPGSSLIGIAIAISLISIAAFFYISIIWQFALPAALLEGCNPIAALSRSYQLVRGSWWRVFGIIAVLWLMVLGIDVVASFIPLIGRFASAIFVPPITFISSALLYFDLRVRKEGYNLDALANELGLKHTLTDNLATPQQ